MTIPVVQLIADGLPRGFGQRERALLDNGRQFACRTNKAADFDASSLAIDYMHREQRASIDLVVEPHIGNPVEEHLRADRRVQHSNHSKNIGPMNPPTRLMFNTLSKLAERGLSYAEAAWEIEAPYRYVARFAKQYGIPFQLERRGPKPHDEGMAAA